MNIPDLPLRKTPVGSAEMKEDGLIAALGYLLVLFFLPVVMRPNSKLGKSCANQGLTLLAIFVAFSLIQLIFRWIPIIGFITNALCALVMVVDVAFAIYAFYSLYANKTAIELPYSLNVFR